MTGSFPTLLPSGSMSEGNGRNRVGRKQEVNEVMKFKVTNFESFLNFNIDFVQDALLNCM